MNIAETIGGIFALVAAAILYCVMTAVGFLLWLVPLAIGLWIIGHIVRFIF